ncbi:MAG: DUF929 family protein [Candidatus Dormibacteria bacterium]
MSKKSVAERRQALGQGGPGGRNGNGRGGRGSTRAAGRRSQRGQKGRPWLLFSLIGGVVAVFVIVIVVLELIPASGAQDTQVLSAPRSVLAAVTKVPASSLAKVGAGDINYPPQAIPGYPKLTANGKPEVLYIGAEFCPYCALERWSLIGALSRFGSFSNLQIIRSSVSDGAGPNIPTFTFAHGVTYKSRYVTFVPKEMFSNVPDLKNPSGFTPFQKLTKQQMQLFLNPKLANSGFPFVDFGGGIAQIGAESANAGPHPQPGPPALSNLSWQQVAHDLSNLKSSQALMILGGINYDTAAICKITGNKPGSVCSQSVVQQLEAGL